MSSKITYKGNTIANITTTSSKTLKTAGKFCEGDIVIENTQDGGVTPSGTKTITENGTYDVTNFASAIVSVGQNSRLSKTVEINIASDLSANTAILTDDFLTEHNADSDFIVMLFATFTQQTNNYIVFDIASNIAFAGWFYGGSIRSGGGSNIYISPKSGNLGTNNYNGQIYYNSGKLYFSGSSTRILGAGTYKVVMVCANNGS